MTISATPVRQTAEPAARVSGRRRRNRAVVLAVPPLTMLVASSVGATTVPIDWDEGATLSIATRSVPQIIEQAGHLDAVLAPYYLFMHYWIAVFGDSVLAMRAPSILAMAIGVGFVAELGRRMVGPLGGLIAGLITAMVPGMSYYAQEIRPYGFTFMYVAAASVALYRALDRPTWKRWSWYGAALLMVGLSNLLAMLIVVPHAVALWRAWRERPDRSLTVRPAAVAAAAVALVTPLAYLGSRQHSDQLKWIDPLTVSQIYTAPELIFMSAAVAYVVIGLALLGLTGRHWFELAAMAAVPPLILLILTEFGFPAWTPRYVLFIVGPMSILAATALTRFPYKRVPITAVTALVVLAGLAFPKHTEIRENPRATDTKAMAEVIAGRMEPGDVIAFARPTWSLRATLSYYLGEELDGAPGPRDFMVVTPGAEVGELSPIECDNPAVCVGNARRVWYVEPVYLDPKGPGPVYSMLKKQFGISEVWSVHQGSLYLMLATTTALQPANS